jgi:hypothetical protein
MNLDNGAGVKELAALESKLARMPEASADETTKKADSAVVHSSNAATATFGAKEETQATISAPEEVDMSPKRPRENDQRHGFSPPQRGNSHKSRLAQSFDSAQITECLAGFDVDKVVRCAALAIQNDIILTVGKPRPHTANAERLSMCSVFMEPAHLEALQKKARARKGDASGSEDLGSPISLCSPLMSKGEQSPLSPSSGEVSSKSVDLNTIAVRKAPTQWDIYGFLRDAMVGFRLQPEVSVVMVIYLRRFQ